MEESEIVDPCRVSFFVVGLFPNDRAHIQLLNPQKMWECREWETQATLHYICNKAECRDSDGNFYPGMEDQPARLIGTIRAQWEGDKIQVYRTLLPNLQGEENTSEVDAAVLETAACRVAFSKGAMPERDGLEYFLEGVTFFEENLGKMHGAGE